MGCVCGGVCQPRPPSPSVACRVSASTSTALLLSTPPSFTSGAVADGLLGEPFRRCLFTPSVPWLWKWTGSPFVPLASGVARLCLCLGFEEWAFSVGSRQCLLIVPRALALFVLAQYFRCCQHVRRTWPHCDKTLCLCLWTPGCRGKWRSQTLV